MTTLYRIALHGGAGVNPERDYSVVETHLGKLCEQFSRELKDGSTALDIAERAVMALEDSGLYVAGRGSAPNSSGDVECDASIMDGATGKSGGVCAVGGLVNPVAAARIVLSQTPYLLLAGEGAREFAVAQGCAPITDPANHFRLPVGVEPEELLAEPMTLSHGTVGAVVLDRHGNLASATSTGGLFGKLAGRVGDTPLAGIGTWADTQIAISCTGIGEAFVTAGGGRDIAARMRYGGTDLQTAAQAMLAEVAHAGGDGGLIALAKDGSYVMPYNSPGMKRAIAGSDMVTKVDIL